MIDSMTKQLPILVVDHQWPMRQAVTTALNDMGFMNVIQESNGLDAMRTLRTTPVAAVISDWTMPGMSGLGLLRWLRS
jgi:two-component system, sensor histidine kinase and response regulator